jgi:hypothetical protein
MKIDIVNPLDIPDWDEQILRFPGYSFFHCSAWARVLSESYGYKPLYFTIFNDKAISACLPMMEVNSIITGKRGVSLPFSDYCEPLAQSGNEFYELFAGAVKYGEAHGWKYLELRGGSSFLNGKPASAMYLGHTLDLTGRSQPATCNLQQVVSVLCPLSPVLIVFSPLSVTAPEGMSGRLKRKVSRRSSQKPLMLSWNSVALIQSAASGTDYPRSR